MFKQGKKFLENFIKISKRNAQKKYYFGDLDLTMHLLNQDLHMIITLLTE